MFHSAGTDWPYWIRAAAGSILTSAPETTRAPPCGPIVAPQEFLLNTNDPVRLVTGQEPAFDGAGTGGLVGLRPVFPGYLRGFTGGERAARFGVVHFVNFVHAARIAGEADSGKMWWV